MPVARPHTRGSEALVGRVHHLCGLHWRIFKAAVAGPRFCFICEEDSIGGFSTERQLVELFLWLVWASFDWWIPGVSIH